MARRRSVEVDEDPQLEPGTTEYEAWQLFEREKAAYEERTGETVNYVPPTPVTRTPIPEVESGELRVESEEPAEIQPEGEG